MTDKGTIITVDIECSSSTPGAKWMHGGEYYYIDADIFVPDGIGIDDIDLLIDLATDEESGLYFVNSQDEVVAAQ